MKKRAAALCCALLMLAQLFAPPARAAVPVYFTAVNETVLELSDATMPFWRDGNLYVSTALFSTRELGIYYSWNSVKQTVVLSAGNRALIFNLAEGTVMDGSGEAHWPPAVQKGSGVFLPVSMAARFFGLTYTNTPVSNGYLIRVCSDDSVLADAAFIDAASFQLSSRYSQYLKAKEPVNSGGSSEPQTQPETAVSGQSIELCFQVTNAASAESVLNILSSSGANATFYFSREQILTSGDLLRRMIADGCAVGLTADASARRDPVVRQLRSANEALCAQTGGKTRLCRIENSTKAAVSAAEEAGYCCLSADLDRSGSGLSGSGGAEALLRKIAARKGTVSVLLAENVGTAGLRVLLSAAGEADDRLISITELG